MVIGIDSLSTLPTKLPIEWATLECSDSCQFSRSVEVETRGATDAPDLCNLSIPDKLHITQMDWIGVCYFLACPISQSIANQSQKHKKAIGTIH
jgi:hypothetical protein